MIAGLPRNEYERQLRQRNPEYAKRQQENTRKWIALNPKRKQQLDAAYHKAHPKAEQKRSRNLKKYGLTPEDYDQMLAQQNGVCKICGREANKRLHVDHCHKTGRVRGLLCFRCNYGLSWFQEDADRLAIASTYLR